MGRAGRWSARSGVIPSASNGWGVGPIYRASIRSASIHAIHGACGSRSRPGGIWFTEDAGASWAQRGEGMRAEHVPPELTHDPVAQDVHCLAQCPAAPYRMWVQHHNGIFVSSDEGKTFNEITDVEPSTFGFPVVVHPQDPNTAWFVPEIEDEKRIPRDGRLVVTRTRDGGKSFDILTKGLPQRHAYDVVYRHALTLDATGDRLAFGSTTGGLWVSENQGEQWSNVTYTLPPIYAVRFA